MPHFLGIDLGGSQIKTGLLNSPLEVSASHSSPTNASQGADSVIESIVANIRTVMETAGVELQNVAAVGIAAPGLLDLRSGVVLKAPNLGWRNVPLSAQLSTALGKPVVLENDANAAALAEWRAGACQKRSVRDMAMVTLGTGVGGGLIVNGQIVHGGAGLGGEFGHMILQPEGHLCACGQRGCLETYASAPSIVKRMEERLSHHEPASLTISDVVDFAQRGDEAARQTLYEAADYLAIGCLNLCRIFDPQVITLGGGVADVAGDTFIEQVYAAMRRRYWQLSALSVEIVLAELGNDAGFIGAASVARDRSFPEHEAA